MHDADPEKVRMMKSHFVRNREFFSEGSKREKGGVRFVWNWHLSSFFMFLRIFFFFSPGRRQLCKWHRCCCSTAAAKNCLVFFWKVLTWCLSWTEAKLQPVKALTAKNKIFRLLSIISPKKTLVSIISGFWKATFLCQKFRWHACRVKRVFAFFTAPVKSAKLFWATVERHFSTEASVVTLQRRQRWKKTKEL